MFSRRTELDRTPNRWATAVQQARQQGGRLWDLTLSNPTQADLPYDASALRAALAPSEALRYEPTPFGLRPAREAIALEQGCDPGSLMLTASTSEAYSHLFKLLCDPGDRVLVPQPSYPLLHMIARFDDVELIPYRLAYDGVWHVDFGSVREAIDERTRALVTVHPNNPTGSFLKRDELEGLLDTGLPILSDEVFARYPIGSDPERAQTVLEANRGLVFALGGLSKLAGLPQLKLGWLAAGGEKAKVQEALARLELISDAFLSVATPVQHAAPALLQHTAPVHRAIQQRIETNLEHLHRRTQQGSAATVLRVEGGWYATLRLPRTGTEEEWVLDLLEAGVIVQPGWLYDFEDEPYVVLSLLTPPEQFAEGTRRLLERVDG